MKLIASLALIAFYSSPAIAQEPHVHGQNVPDWYDAACCDRRDCKPVEDNDVVFEQFEGQWVARYVPTGNRFSRNQFRVSQDERYHVCINKSTDASMCFYDRPGA
jgi:hypothetical protein